MASFSKADLTVAAYEAALEPALWPSVLEQLVLSALAPLVKLDLNSEARISAVAGS